MTRAQRQLADHLYTVRMLRVMVRAAERAVRIVGGHERFLVLSEDSHRARATLERALRKVKGRT